MFNELDAVDRAFIVFLKALSGFLFAGTVFILGVGMGFINV